MGIFTTVWSVVGAVAVLLVFVLVHEIGHYVAGKKLGFEIVEFAIGFGPRLYKKEKNGTLFSIKAFPLGGSCLFQGEDSEVTNPRSFNAQKRWKRAVVLVSGAAMNILFSLVIAFIVMVGYGDFGRKKIIEVTPGYPAQTAGVLPGDVITSINGKQLQLEGDAVDYILEAQSDSVTLGIERDGSETEIIVSDIYNQEQGRNIIGITMNPVRTHFGFFDGIKAAVRTLGSMVKQVYAFLGTIFTQGVNPGDVTGPVGTINIIGMAVRSSFELVLRLCVIIGVNLGIVNLLPFPGLDGGRLVFIGVEAVRRKALPVKVEAMVNFVGIMLLFGLMIFLTFSDIQNLISG